MREYTFRVLLVPAASKGQGSPAEDNGAAHQPPSVTQTEPRDFLLTIPHEAFLSHRVRYQDAPDICSLKLQRELATYANHPPHTHFRISDAELAEYLRAHAPETTRSPYSPKPAEGV